MTVDLWAHVASGRQMLAEFLETLETVTTPLRHCYSR